MDSNMDDGFGTFAMVAGIMFGVFFVITCCVICAACYSRRKRQAMFSTPVVVTSQSFEPSNRAPHQVSVHTSVAPTNYLPTSQPPPLPSNVPPTTINMPMPMPVHQNTFQPPYPPTTGPYVNNSTPFSINGSTAPYPPSDSNAPPPTYNQIVQGNKQPAFNPNFNG